MDKQNQESVQDELPSNGQGSLEAWSEVCRLEEKHKGFLLMNRKEKIELPIKRSVCEFHSCLNPYRDFRSFFSSRGRTTHSFTSLYFSLLLLTSYIHRFLFLWKRFSFVDLISGLWSCLRYISCFLHFMLLLLQLLDKKFLYKFFSNTFVIAWQQIFVFVRVFFLLTSSLGSFLSSSLWSVSLHPSLDAHLLLSLIFFTLLFLLFRLEIFLSFSFTSSLLLWCFSLHFF